MIYNISINNLSPILNKIKLEDDVVVTKLIYDLFKELSLDKIKSNKVLENVFSELLMIANNSNKKDFNIPENLSKILQNLKINKNKLFEIIDFKLILNESENIKKITTENLVNIKEVVYRYTDPDESFIKLDVKEKDFSFNSKKDYWLIQSVLISYGIFLNNNVQLHSLEDKNIKLIGQSLTDVLPSVTEYKDNGQINLIEKNFLNSTFDFEFFTNVVSKYLSEDTGEIKFASSTENLKYLISIIDNNNFDSILEKIAKLIIENGYSVFEQPGFLKSYVECFFTLKEKGLISLKNINYFLENSIDKIPNEFRYMNFPVFNENEKISKLFMDEINTEDFFILITGMNLDNFEKNIDSNSLTDLAEILLTIILESLRKTIVLNDQYGQTRKKIKKQTVGFNRRYLYDNVYEWYFNTILEQHKSESSKYWSELKKYFILDDNHPHKFVIDEYTYKTKNMENAFNLISEGLDILNCLYEQKDIPIAKLENLVKIFPFNDDFSNTGNNILSTNIAEIVDHCKYYLTREEFANSDILNVNMQKYYVFEHKNSKIRSFFNYKEVVQNFLNGSTRQCDNIFLNKDINLLLQKNSYIKEDAFFKYINKLDDHIHYDTLIFNGSKINSPEDLVIRLLSEGTEKQKEVGFVLYYIFPMVTNFNQDIELHQSYKNIFLKLKKENPTASNILVMNDKVLDFDNCGKIINNSNNKNLLELCILDIEDYIDNNIDFFKSPDIVDIYINSVERNDLTIANIQSLFTVIYQKVGSEFFDDLWNNMEKCSEGNNLTKNLAYFLVITNNQLPQLKLSADIFFDKLILKEFFEHNDYWIDKIPTDYLRHKKTMSIFDAIKDHENTRGTVVENLLKVLPKEVINTPQNIMKILEVSRNKLKVLNELSPQLHDYCELNKVDNSDVLEKIEIIFNTMMIEKMTQENPVTNKNAKAKKF